MGSCHRMVFVGQAMMPPDQLSAVVEAHTTMPPRSPGGQHVQTPPTCSCGWQEPSLAQLWKHQAEGLREELALAHDAAAIARRAAELAIEQRDTAEAEAVEADRLRCIGNAVVPQVAEWVGRLVLGSTETREGAE
jgi:site-specific DNA-cytosine methylase